MECMWNAYGMHMECMWNAYGMHMECMWIFPFWKRLDWMHPSCKHTNFFEYWMHTDSSPLFSTSFTLDAYGILPFLKVCRLNLHGFPSPLFSSSHSTNTEYLQIFLVSQNAYGFLPFWNHSDFFQHWMHTDLSSFLHFIFTECIRIFPLLKVCGFFSHWMHIEFFPFESV